MSNELFWSFMGWTLAAGAVILVFAVVLLVTTEVIRMIFAQQTGGDAMRPVIYVAGPISKGDLCENVYQAHVAAVLLTRAGYAVVCPHGNCFWGNKIRNEAWIPQADHSGITHSEWIDADLALVARCDYLLRLPGESPGAEQEVKHAMSLGIPVFASLESALAAMEAKA